MKDLANEKMSAKVRVLKCQQGRDYFRVVVEIHPQALLALGSEYDADLITLGGFAVDFFSSSLAMVGRPSTLVLEYDYEDNRVLPPQTGQELELTAPRNYRYKSAHGR
jgi:hypothetical protein